MNISFFDFYKKHNLVRKGLEIFPIARNMLRKISPHNIGQNFSHNFFAIPNSNQPILIDCIA